MMSTGRIATIAVGFALLIALSGSAEAGFVRAADVLAPVPAEVNWSMSAGDLAASELPAPRPRRESPEQKLMYGLPVSSGSTGSSSSQSTVGGGTLLVAAVDSGAVSLHVPGFDQPLSRPDERVEPRVAASRLFRPPRS